MNVASLCLTPGENNKAGRCTLCMVFYSATLPNFPRLFPWVLVPACSLSPNLIYKNHGDKFPRIINFCQFLIYQTLFLECSSFSPLHRGAMEISNCSKYSWSSRELKTYLGQSYRWFVMLVFIILHHSCLFLPVCGHSHTVFWQEWSQLYNLYTWCIFLLHSAFLTDSSHISIFHPFSRIYNECVQLTYPFSRICNECVLLSYPFSRIRTAFFTHSLHILREYLHILWYLELMPATF